MTEEIGLPDEIVLSKIYLIRGQKVMLDRDLAELYGVETKRLKEQVKRNMDRFPDKYMFELTKGEAESLRSQNATLKKRGTHSKYALSAFTEHGVLQLSNVLKSQRAIEVSFRIIDVFIKVREMLIDNTEVRLEIEKIKQILNNQSKNMEVVFQYLDELQGKMDKLSPTLRSKVDQIGFKIGK